MKKILSVVLVLIMVLSLCACAPGGEGGSAGAKNTFQVGYGREKIMPEKSVPMRGYGRSERRMSTGFLDYLYSSCIAITDAQEKTILVMSTDLAGGDLKKEIRALIKTELGIPEEHIFINYTHTHSGPDIYSSHANITTYKNVVLKGHLASAKQALEDRQPAEMYYGTSETEGLNFVRHYLMEDGTYAGDNFGNHSQKYVDYATVADPTIHIVKFDRGEEHKPIVMMNWRAHPTMTGGSDLTDISADFVGSVREYLEKELGCWFSYLQGAAGNINPRSRIKEDTPTTDYKLYGKQLGSFAMKAMENMQKLEAGTIQTSQTIFKGTVDHSKDDMKDVAKTIQDMWNGGASFNQCKEYGMPYGIRSPYMANSILKNIDHGEFIELELNVFTLGDQLAFCTAPNEIFDTNGAYVEDNSCYEHTIFLAYTNGQSGYIPSAFGYEYTCYESDNTRFVAGTAELLVENHVNMLKALKGE